MRKETTDNRLTFINPKFFFSVQEKPQLNIILIYHCYHLFKNTLKLTVQHINILKAIETNRLKKMIILSVNIPSYRKGPLSTFNKNIAK